MRNLRLTVGELAETLSAAIKRGSLDKTAVILWAEQTNEGDEYCKEFDVPNGTVLLGLEMLKNGNVERGTYSICPKKLHTYVQ